MIQDSFRVIAKLDIKDSAVIKGINFEGMRKVGDAKQLSQKYFLEGADELIINDVNASLFGRNTAIDFLKTFCEKIFIPITLQGGFRTLKDIKTAMRNGADKVSINTGAVYDKKLVKNASKIYGNQAIVVSMDVKKISNKKWEVFVDKGRERTGKSLVDWIKFVQDSGAGEMHISSIDMDGTQSGFDIELIRTINKICKIPVIIGGGLGATDHLKILDEFKHIEGLSASACLHYDNLSISKIKGFLKKKVNIRI